jgi:hypothetical protein
MAAQEGVDVKLRFLVKNRDRLLEAQFKYEGQSPPSANGVYFMNPAYTHIKLPILPWEVSNMPSEVQCDKNLSGSYGVYIGT